MVARVPTKDMETVNTVAEAVEEGAARTAAGAGDAHVPIVAIDRR